MARTTIISLIVLALVLPSTIALPFDFNFFKGNHYEGPWQPHYLRPSPYTTYATTAVTAATGTGTGTAVYPTGTGYVRRDLKERQFIFPFPTAFPTATGFSYPTSFPTSGPGLDSHEAGSEGTGHFGGPRKGNEHPYYPYAPVAYTSEPTSAAPTATAPSFTAPTAPFYTASGFPIPTEAW